MNKVSYSAVLGQLNLDDTYIREAFKHYHQRYQKNEDAQRFVKTSSSIPDALRSHDYVGYCDRTFGLDIKSSRTFDGGGSRGHYFHCGLFIPYGGELFRGYIVFPEYDETSEHFVSAVGYRFGRVQGKQRPVVCWHRPEPNELIMAGMNKVKEVAHGKAYH